MHNVTVHIKIALPKMPRVLHTYGAWFTMCHM
jgi:hypothetical protein